jgi:arsenate reductase (thioredoxin)
MDAQRNGRRKTKVLFLCIGNSCRSQIAEAMARHIYPTLIEAESAGLAPLGIVARETMAALQERGIRAEGLYSKSISEVTAFFDPEIVVNISGHSVGDYFPQTKTLEWEIKDPYGSNPEIYRGIIGDIEKLLNGLAEELQRGEKS